MLPLLWRSCASSVSRIVPIKRRSSITCSSTSSFLLYLLESVCSAGFRSFQMSGSYWNPVSDGIPILEVFCFPVTLSGQGSKSNGASPGETNNMSRVAPVCLCVTSIIFNFFVGESIESKQNPTKAADVCNMAIYYIYKYKYIYIYIFLIYVQIYIYISTYIYNFIHIFTNILTPRGAIRALGAGVIILDNYIINMITCSKALRIPVKKCILNAYDFQYIDISKGKNSTFLKLESGFQIHLQIVNTLHEKCTWHFKKLHGKQKMPYASRISANNRNNIKIQMNKCIGVWTSKCIKPAQGQKNKVLNFKARQTLVTLCSNYIDTFQSESTTPVIYSGTKARGHSDISLKHAIFGRKQLWKR